MKDFSQVDNIDREMLVVNGMPTVIVYVLGALDGKITTLAMAFYEGTDALYQVISYYPYNNQMELRKTIGETFETFREIN